MARVSRKERQFVFIISILIGVVQVATLIINEFFMKAPLVFRTDQLVFLALITTVFPPAIVNYLDTRWKLNVDKNIPEFLREMSEAGRTGVTLTRALDLASRRRYGPLSSELEKVVARLSWGGNFDDAMRGFAERIETKLARRTAVLLCEIHRSGGEIRDVIDMVSKHIRELQTIEEERRSQLRMYIAIVYVAFFIFIFIDYILLKTFFARIESLKEMAKEEGTLFLMKELDVKTITNMMFHMATIQGLFGGLVAGKMGEGALGAGLKHSLILMVIGFLIFFSLM